MYKKKKMDYRIVLAAVVVVIALFIAVTTHKVSAQQSMSDVVVVLP